MKRADDQHEHQGSTAGERRRYVPSCAIRDMFADKTPEEWRNLYSAAFDWGDDMGRERVDDDAAAPGPNLAALRFSR